ncbi:MAG: hypothetical protein IJB79_02810 [Candidatus Gastranaerophilales bacterium]|nr:hypothetical protein [Candidatus Gastranaerophilales bacterium]
MKLTAVNNRQIRQNNNNNKQNSRNIQFKGLTDTLIKTWEIIDSSRGIQFTVEDMLGTNIPRTYSGAMSGYEYSHEINWPYLWQEGIREFLTGPTMTCAPIALLALITKKSGKTANTHKENIVNLSYLANNIKQKEGLDAETFTNTFVKDVVKDAISKTTQTEAVNEDVDALTELIVEYAKQTKTEKEEHGFKAFVSKIKGFFDRKTRMENKAKKESIKEALEKTQEKFEEIIKTRKQSFDDTDFGVVKYSINESETGAQSFKNYVKYISAYAEDYTKANKADDGIINLATEAIDKFRNVWTMKRLGTIGALIFGTGFIMSFIPKLYTLASGGVNPGGKAIYDEAAKREGK